jgi:uncharacterized membrane protein (UPF0127 family)
MPSLALRSARNVERDAMLAARLETADGLWARFMGLMGRPTLEPDTGLWLPNTNGIHMMFMRFRIDAVFLGAPVAGLGEAARVETRLVLSVHPSLRAWTGMVPLVRGAHGVLELPAGTIARTGTAVGDRIVLDAPIA